MGRDVSKGVSIQATLEIESIVELYSKDPAVLQILRDSELLRRSVFTTPPILTTLRTLL